MLTRQRFRSKNHIVDENSSVQARTISLDITAVHALDVCLLREFHRKENYERVFQYFQCLDGYEVATLRSLIHTFTILKVSDVKKDLKLFISESQTFKMQPFMKAACIGLLRFPTSV